MFSAAKLALRLLVCSRHKQLAESNLYLVPLRYCLRECAEMLGDQAVGLKSYATSASLLVAACQSAYNAVQDPVDDSAAVLVTRYNITQHKELEHELVVRQSSLEQ